MLPALPSHILSSRQFVVRRRAWLEIGKVIYRVQQEGKEETGNHALTLESNSVVVATRRSSRIASGHESALSGGQGLSVISNLF